MELATLPPVQPITVVAAAPAIEPSLPDGGCVIGGHAVSLVGDSIDLCGAPGTACFGRLPAHTYTGVIVESLRVAPSLAAPMVLSANGITVSSIVDARNVGPHPQHVELIDRWFVPESARFSFVRVRDGAAELSVELT